MSKKKILLVDDEKDIVKMNMLRLVESSYEVFSASEGKECIEIAEKEVPDLIIMDVVMPGMDGIETLVKLKSDPRIAHIPVIMLTGMGETAILDKAMASGAVDFIEKPFNGDMLMEAIKKNLPK
jgi:CheY-like chemotaxis protein